jgi:hypothetical protein
MSHIDIVFDGPPGPEAGRFVEVEDHRRHSIKFGEWVQREDGYWVLRIDRPEAKSLATLIQDKDEPQSYRVEAVIEDGGCEVSIFSGPNALDRAIAFAGGNYYDGWADPQGLAGH